MRWVDTTCHRQRVLGPYKTLCLEFSCVMRERVRVFVCVFASVFACLPACVSWSSLKNVAIVLDFLHVECRSALVLPLSLMLRHAFRIWGYGRGRDTISIF